MSFIDELVVDRGQAWIDLRRDFHRNPELGFTEFRTASHAASRLLELGFAVRVGADVMAREAMLGVPAKSVMQQRRDELSGDNIASSWLDAMAQGLTGVVAELSRGDGPVMGFRFDIDALPLQEACEAGHKPVDEGYVSARDNVHHACGHDGHAAIGLGFAEWLSDPKSTWSGTVRLIFQPAEEGGRGAQPMAQAGVADGADWLFAAHLGCGLGSGKIASASAGMLNSTKLDIAFKGVPAHAGANPEDGKNALLAGATATLNLHAISRVSSGSTRVNVGKVTAGTARNIIADTCSLEMEVRGETPQAVEYVEQRARQIVAAAAAMYEVDYEIEVVGQTVSPTQDQEACEVVKKVAEQIPGVDEVLDEFRVTGGEDAPFLMRRVQAAGGKACYFIIGSDLTDFHHTAHFDFDERSIETGVRLFAGIAARVSQNQLG